MNAPMPFDIRDARNTYQPCPKCGALSGMGLVVRAERMAVQCMHCGFRGPDQAIDATLPMDADEPAFVAWNGIPRN